MIFIGFTFSFSTLRSSRYFMVAFDVLYVFLLSSLLKRWWCKKRARVTQWHTNVKVTFYGNSSLCLSHMSFSFYFRPRMFTMKGNFVFVATVTKYSSQAFGISEVTFGSFSKYRKLYVWTIIIIEHIFWIDERPLYIYIE